MCFIIEVKNRIQKPFTYPIIQTSTTIRIKEQYISYKKTVFIAFLNT